MHLKKVLLILICVVILVFGFYSFFVESYGSHFAPTHKSTFKNDTFSNLNMINRENSVNVWCIFSKVYKNAPLKGKFRVFLQSILNHSSVSVNLNILTDNKSRPVAENIIKFVMKLQNKTLAYTFYDIHKSARKIDDIVSVMMPYFSSQPGTYYSDALFYLSLGLYRIAPVTQNKAIMLDCDIKFVSDIKELYELFESFKPETLFGLAPELTPVYRHALYNYRLKNKNTTFGDYSLSVNNRSGIKTGYPGYNSGVVLIDFYKIRRFSEYKQLIGRSEVEHLTSKYMFKGHLGDQDYFTLLGFEYPHLIKRLPCVFNRQLCTWWKEHGYADVFDQYFRCDGPIRIYHGNCNTPIPKTNYFYNSNNVYR